MLQTPKASLLRYAVAVTAVMIALLLTLLLWRLIEGTPFPLFFAAVIFSAWYSGLGPALLATVLSTVVTAYFFLLPSDSLQFSWENIMRLGLFLTVSLLISSLATTRKQTEDVSPSTDELFQLLVESIRDYAIFMLDTKGRVVSWNKGAERILGYQEAEIVGQPVSRFFTPEDIQQGVPEEELRKAESEGQAEDERWQVRRDGTRFWASGVMTVLRDGALRGFVKVLRDETKRKQAEEQIRFQANALYQVNDAVIALDQEQRITYWNAAAERLYNTKADAVLGRRLEEVYQYGWLKAGDEQAAYASLATTGAWHGKNIHVKPNGEEIYVECSVSTLKDEKGTAVGLLAVIRDITKRKQMEKELSETQECTQFFLEQIPATFWATDTDLRVTFLAGGALKNVHRRYHEMVGFTLYEILQTNDPEYLPIANHHRALQGEYVTYEMTWMGRDFVVHVKPFRAPDEKIKGTISVALDITENKQVEEKLHETNESLQAIIQYSPLAIMAFCPTGNIWLWNPAAERMFGWSAQEVLGGPNPTVPEDKQEEFESLRQRVLGGEAFVGEEAIRKKKDGSIIYVSLSTAPLRDAAGNVKGTMTVLADITGRKQTEERLKRSEMQLAEAQRLAHVGSWDWDLATNTVTWSDELYRIYGLNEQVFNPSLEAFLECVHPDDREFVKGIIEKALQERHSFSFYHRITLPDGAERLIYSRGTVVADEIGNLIRMYGTAQDITERRQAEDELRRSHKQLRALSARLQCAREEERARIAREVHDELGQALTGLKMDLAWLNKRLPEANNEVAHQKIASMTKLIDETIKSVRKIATELRPGILDDLGLTAAIEWQAQEFQQRTGIECEIISLPEVTLNPERSTAVFRIFQEILTNVMRHANATRVTISMRASDDDLILEVSDSGRGITEKEISDTKSLGLLGMRERALLLGGELTISGTEGAGSVVTLRIPNRRHSDVEH